MPRQTHAPSDRQPGHSHLPRWVPPFLIPLCLILLAGCSAAHHRKAADKQVYGIIQSVEQQIFGRTNQFSIDTPYSSRKPDDITARELVEDRLQTNRRVLTLAVSLDLAVRNSRTYQAEKERLYLTALTLTGERYAFSPQFLASSSAGIDRAANGDVTGSVNNKFSVSQLLTTGGKLSANIANDLLRYYTGDPRRSAISTLSVNLAQPLLRGFGRNNSAVESITQAERNVIYAVRNYSYFQDQFALGIVTDYLNLLTQKDTVRNQYANYLSRVANLERLDARKDRESRSGVDQARQAELSARNAYINAVAAYFTSLDQFKIKLGLPLADQIQLDDNALKELQDAGPIPLSMERVAGFRLAIDKHLPTLNAIDRFEDSKRKVRLAKDQLRADLNFVADASLDSDRPTDYTQFDPNRWRGGAGLELNLPFDRLRQRNSYRSSLVTFESEVRSLTLTLDTLRDNIERGLRNLEQRYQNFVIQTNALSLARDRVDSTAMMQQAGLVQIRDVLEAQDSLVAAQNAVTEAIIRYQSSRLQLLLDLGVLDTEQDRFWLLDHLPNGLAGANPSGSAELSRDRILAPDVLFTPTP